MPGQLYHTNEIMVLLGDNWFAKRSAKQAIEMVERRKQCTFGGGGDAGLWPIPLEELVHLLPFFVVLYMLL